MMPWDMPPPCTDSEAPGLGEDAHTPLPPNRETARRGAICLPAGRPRDHAEPPLLEPFLLAGRGGQRAAVDGAVLGPRPDIPGDGDRGAAELRRGRRGAPVVSHEEYEGVEIVRVGNRPFDKKSLLKRVVGLLSYLLLAAWAAFRHPRLDVIVVETDPPVLGALGALLPGQGSARGVLERRRPALDYIPFRKVWRAASCRASCTGSWPPGRLTSPQLMRRVRWPV
jgi:hypothetical protein